MSESRKAKVPRNLDFSALFGTLEGIRTPDLPLRRRPLYPTELQAQMLLLLYPPGLSLSMRKRTKSRGETLAIGKKEDYNNTVRAKILVRGLILKRLPYKGEDIL